MAEFEIIGLIGEGGFGIVYLARDTSLGRVVALKEFMPGAFAGRVDGVRVAVRAANHLPTFDAGLRSFINEAKMLAQFSHPALVEVYRFWEANGTAYMAMRFYQGETLRQVLSAGERRFDEDAVAQTMGPIFDALEMLHREQVFHRDIAPDNIMLADGRPVLLDFGSARRIVSDGTQALTTVLKPGYAPIEQYSDDGAMKQGAWTDVYALGGVLYHLATGKAPVQAVSRMLVDPLQSVNEVTAERFSKPFSEAVAKAMSVHVANRFQTVTEFREALGWNIGALARVITVQHATIRVETDAVPPDSEPQIQVAHDWLETAASGAASATIERQEKRQDVGKRPARTRRALLLGWVAVAGLAVAGGLATVLLRAPSSVALEGTGGTSAHPAPEVSAAAPSRGSTNEAESLPTGPTRNAVNAVNAVPGTGARAGVGSGPAATAAAPSAAAVGEGLVKFEIKPRGRIDVDGFARAVSPPTTELTLPVGEHTIEVFYSPSVSVKRSVVVSKDQPITFSHTFK